MIYLITLPIIIYVALQVTILNNRIQVWKKTYELDYPRYYKDVSITRWFFSKVLNCTICFSGWSTIIILLITGHNILLIPILTFITMMTAKEIEHYLLWK
jgi:hypothetical protein